MALARSWIVMVALAALSPVSSYRLPKLCESLNRAMSEDENLRVDGEKAFIFAENWLRANYSPLSNNLIKAWENIYKGKECSASSWDYLFLLSICSRDVRNPSERAQAWTLEVVHEPIKAYANKCLSPEYASKRIKSEVSGALSKKVDFVDDTFIGNYYAANHGDRTLDVISLGPHIHNGDDDDHNCCSVAKSYDAVNDSIERSFAKRGKDAKKEFRGDRLAVEKFLAEKLLKPCRSFVAFYEYLPSQIGMVTMHYKGGQDALISSLDQEAKNVLFRYKYCRMLGFSEGKVLEEAEKKFL